jgi:hypothetical protein
MIIALHLAGLTDIEIHFPQIKYNAIGIYLDKTLASMLMFLCLQPSPLRHFVEQDLSELQPEQ